MKRVYKIDVPGKNGYSFAVRGEFNSEEAAISEALAAGIFDDDCDAEYAVAEDITESEYDLNAFKDCINDL